MGTRYQGRKALEKLGVHLGRDGECPCGSEEQIPWPAWVLKRVPVWHVCKALMRLFVLTVPWLIHSTARTKCAGDLGVAVLRWAGSQPSAVSRRPDGLERCPPGKGNLSAPPPDRVEAASCFPAWAGREEPSSQLAGRIV